MLRTLTGATSTSPHTASERCTGYALIVQKVIPISGRPKCTTEQRMMAVHSAEAKECVSTTLLLPKLPTWLPAGTAQPMMALHKTSQLTAISKQWQCPVCGHKWLASVGHRVGLKPGCTECYNLKRTRPKVRHCTLAACNHPLLKEWDTEANAKEGLFPDKLRLGSNKRVHGCATSVLWG